MALKQIYKLKKIDLMNNKRESFYLFFLCLSLFLSLSVMLKIFLGQKLAQYQLFKSSFRASLRRIPVTFRDVLLLLVLPCLTRLEKTPKSGFCVLSQNSTALNLVLLAVSWARPERSGMAITPKSPLNQCVELIMSLNTLNVQQC